MWSELSFPWQSAVEMAWEAACCGSIPIGAAILDGQGRLVAAGRNRLYEPRSTSPHFLAGSALAHAEMNALLALDVHALNPRECTLYTTTEPCPMCAGALVMANVRHVCFASRDPWAGATHLYASDRYMSSKRIRLEGPPDPLLEAVLVALQVEFFLAEGARSGQPILARGGQFINSIGAAVPLGAALGERAYEEGILQRLREERAPTGEMIDALVERLAHRERGDGAAK